MKKKIIIVSAALLVIVAIALLMAFNVISLDFLKKTNGPDTGNKPAEKQPSDYDILGEAITEKDIGRCKDTDNYSMNDCIYTVALEANDSEYCLKISDNGLKEKCRNSVLANQAVGAMDAGKCSEIPDETIRNACLNDIFKNVKDSGFCSKLKDNLKKLCNDWVKASTAYDKGKVEDCENISDPALKSSCRVTTSNKPKDMDNDGLNDYLENSLGTDRLKKDTDGDGMSDYDELKNNRDPRTKDTAKN